MEKVKMLNTVIEFEFCNGTTTNLTLQFYRLYQLKSKKPQLYATYNKAMNSNANGNYIKFANGILINMKTLSGTTTASLWENNIYYKDINNGSWAVPFSTLINIQVTNNTSQFWASVTDDNTTSAGKTRLIRASSTANQAYDIRILAIGTWE